MTPTAYSGGMPQRTDIFDLGAPRAHLRRGPAPGPARPRRPVRLGGSRYAVEPELVPVRLDISRTTGNGWALRLRFAAALDGPCMRCLETAAPTFEVDSYEVHQPGAGDGAELALHGRRGRLDLEAWARDALALALPAQITCRPDCARPVPAVRREPQRGPDARPRGRARPALGEAVRAQVRLAGWSRGARESLPFPPPWPSPSRSSRTRAPRSARAAQDHRARGERLPAVPPAAPSAPRVPALRVLRRARGRVPTRTITTTITRSPERAPVI